ncbi:hypothetical protein HMPREF9265_0735 [Limosilactobacillus oris PB013-T2-3]|uniref:Uncharacterized protein n=1 Tax=Limosilactobacillus oris PB013-T2-3 TaxID=908339 RepID=E3C8G2_9LACO|nr:hypothetical protein HMPREF9265_0735 [Limosilactobacillus oris PB013-T2-3]
MWISLPLTNYCLFYSAVHYIENERNFIKNTVFTRNSD